MNRPEGHRLLDAPAVQININEFILQLKEEKAWKTSDRNAITVFKTETVTVVISAFRKGVVIDDLKIKGLVLLQVLDGEVTVANNDASAVLGSNQLIALHEGSACSVKAEAETILQLTYIKVADLQ